MARVALLHFVVDADGGVDPATVTVTRAPGHEVASIALDVVKLLRFEPATRAGVRVAMWTDFTVTVPLRP